MKWRAVLQHGVHVLVEKPITTTVAQADELIELARHQGLVLQVGHVERFNPAWNAVAPHLAAPQYIEAVRAGSYTFRATDVSIVLDLMIHDIDLVLSVTQSPLVDVEAMGIALFGPHEDLALARLKFANGCVASLRASRINYEPQRSMQVYARGAFASIDFAQGQATLVQPSRHVLAKQVDLTCCPPDQREAVQQSMFETLLSKQHVTVERINAILEEQREFAASVQHAAPVRVDGQQGREALQVAEQILGAIAEHRWNGLSPEQIGPHARHSPRLQGPDVELPDRRGGRFRFPPFPSERPGGPTTAAPLAHVRCTHRNRERAKKTHYVLDTCVRDIKMGGDPGLEP